MYHTAFPYFRLALNTDNFMCVFSISLNFFFYRIQRVLFVSPPPFICLSFIEMKRKTCFVFFFVFFWIYIHLFTFCFNSFIFCVRVTVIAVINKKIIIIDKYTEEVSFHFHVFVLKYSSCS